MEIPSLQNNLFMQSTNQASHLSQLTMGPGMAGATYAQAQPQMMGPPCSSMATSQQMPCPMGSGMITQTPNQGQTQVPGMGAVTFMMAPLGYCMSPQPQQQHVYQTGPAPSIPPPPLMPPRPIPGCHEFNMQEGNSKMAMGSSNGAEGQQLPEFSTGPAAVTTTISRRQQPKHQRAQQRQRQAMGTQSDMPCPASAADIVKAIESLCLDELKPYGRILRKRLSERGHDTVDIGIQELRTACETCPLLTVQSEGGADWSAQISGHTASFVDVYSPVDLYPPDLWWAAEVYFKGLGGKEMILPGGRYACAQLLQARGLGFLKGCSLGQVCHIVQLCISQKKLLGYLNGSIVPYDHSQSMVKEACAERCRPCTSNARGKTVATWDMVYSCLQEIIRSMSPDEKFIPLSNVKRFFRLRFQVELSETALGYAKLSELVHDPRLQDLCQVRLHGHGYVLVPVPQLSQMGNLEKTKISRSRNTISLAERLPEFSPQKAKPEATAMPDGPSLNQRAHWIQPLCLDEVCSDAPSPKQNLQPASAKAYGGTPSMGISADVDTQQFPLAIPFPPTPSPRATPCAMRLAEHSRSSTLEGLGSIPRTALSQNNVNSLPRLLGSSALTMIPGDTKQRSQQPVPHKDFDSNLWNAPLSTPSEFQDMGFSVPNTFLNLGMSSPALDENHAGSFIGA